MICLECHQPMAQLESGAFVRCCNGIGYIARVIPLPRDQWAPWPLTVCGYIYRNWFKRIPA